LEVIWTTTPTKWSNNFFTNLFSYDWELTKSPAGAHQWDTEEWRKAMARCRNAHDPSKRHAPSMLTTDLALRFDAAYEKISRRFYEHPEQFAERVCAGVVQADSPRHGPIVRYLGPLGSEGDAAVRPDPRCDHALIGEQDIAALKAKILASGLSVSQLSRPWGVGVNFPRF